MPEKEASELIGNFEVNKEENKVIVFINPRIFPVSAVNKAASFFNEQAWVSIDGDPREELLVEIKPKKEYDLELLGREFNNKLVQYSTDGINVAKENLSLVSQIKEVIKKFASEEKGKVSKQSVITIGAILASLGLASVVNATHLCGGGGDGGGGNGGACCLPAGTNITMADGSLKNIEEINVNDNVLAFDEAGKEIKPAKVSELFSIVREGYYKINNSLLRITNDHPIYAKKPDGAIGWAAIDPEKSIESYPMVVKKLEVGDEVFTANTQGNELLTVTKQWVKIASMDYVEGPIQTYHLEIEQHSTYFADGVLVHNQVGGCDIGSGGNDCTCDTGCGGAGCSGCSSGDCGSCCYCFPAGTKIAMADGSLKNVEEIKINDAVLAYDLSTKKTKTAKVLELDTKVREGYYRLNDNLLRVTDDHPIYIRKKGGTLGWGAINKEKAKKSYSISYVHNLQIGDEIFTLNEGWVILTDLEYVKGAVKVYTLKDIENFDAFFADNVLVLKSLSELEINNGLMEHMAEIR